MSNAPATLEERPSAEQVYANLLPSGAQDGNAELSTHPDLAVLSHQLGELGTTELVDLGNLGQQSPESQRTRNAQMASDLHTLLSSLPPGQMLGALRRIPELGGTFSVGEVIKSPGQDEYTQGAMLKQLLAQAEQIVGGKDRATRILEYPGVTTDQDLELVRPARADWLDTFEDANTYGPQMDVLVATKVGHKVFEDIAAGRASWQDVVYGHLGKDQIANQKELVAKLHNAFGVEPAMPADHTHPKTLFTIPDARFGYLWRQFSVNYVNMGRAIADWVEQSEGIKLPEAAEPTVGKGGEAVIDPANAARLDALFGDQKYRPYIDTFISLYTAAEQEIDSERGQTLQKEHRMQMNTRKSKEPDWHYVYVFNKVVRKSVTDRIEELKRSGTLQLPDDLEQRFMENVEEPE